VLFLLPLGNAYAEAGIVLDFPPTIDDLIFLEISELLVFILNLLVLLWLIIKSQYIVAQL